MMDVDVYINVHMLIDEAIELFGEEKYTEAIEKLDQAWDKIQDKNTLVSEQSMIQLYLLYCYLNQSKRTKIADEKEKLLELAVEHNQKWLKLVDKKGTSDNKSMPNFVLAFVVLHRRRKPKIQTKGKHFPNRQVKIF